MKGITMSINIVVLIAVGVMAIVSIAVFFGSSSLQSVSDIETQRVFAGGCAKYCSPDLFQTMTNAFNAMQNDPQFVAACLKLGYTDEAAHLNRCMEKCGNCNFNVNQQDLNGWHDRTIAVSGGG